MERRNRGKEEKNNKPPINLSLDLLFSYSPLAELDFEPELGWRLYCHDPALQKPASLSINFLQGKYAYRQRRISITNEAILRAVGVHKTKHRLRVCDATAGLGMDSLVLAEHGCEVTCLERSAYLALLLHDAWYRYLCVRQKPLQMNIVWIDAKNYLTRCEADRFDVIYLDPMYPVRDQSALSQQPIRLVRSLVGEDRDAEEVLMLARKIAKKRVVVKRPMQAPFLSNLIPDYQIKQKNHRFDVYLSLLK